MSSNMLRHSGHLLWWFTGAILLLSGEVGGYGSGAPSSVCGTMAPGHGSEQSGTTYSLTLSPDDGTYTPDGTISVTVSGGDYQGILLKARTADSYTPIGTWSSFPSSTRSLQCSSPDDAVTHSSTATKNGVTYTWTAPNTDMGNIYFVATVAQQKNVWWKDVSSSTLVNSETVTTETVTSEAITEASETENTTEDTSEENDSEESTDTSTQDPNATVTNSSEEDNDGTNTGAKMTFGAVSLLAGFVVGMWTSR